MPRQVPGRSRRRDGGGEGEDEHPCARSADAGGVAEMSRDSGDQRDGHHPQPRARKRTRAGAEHDGREEAGADRGEPGRPGAEGEVGSVEPGERTEGGEHRVSRMSGQGEREQRRSHGDDSTERCRHALVAGMQRQDRGSSRTTSPPAALHTQP
jgi:hypothetical protein